MRRSLIVLGLSAACTTESWFDVQVTPSPLAVGATAHGAVQRCISGSQGPMCSGSRLTVESVTVAPDGVFALTTSEHLFTLDAMGEGSATLTVIAGTTGESPETFTRQVNAVAADRVLVAPMLRDAPCSTPVLYPVSLRATLPYELRRESVALHGDGYLPIAIAGATIDPESVVDGSFDVQLPAAPAMLTVTSPIDPALNLPLEVFAPSSVDAIALATSPGPFRLLGVAELTIDLMIAGRAVCADGLSRTVTVDTPSICKIAYADNSDPVATVTAAGLQEVRLRGLAAGTCTVRVNLGGATLSATTSLQVTM